MVSIEIGVAFLFGLAARLVGWPPLVGFLAAGFALHAFGLGIDETLEALADVGIHILLFGIGLKLKIGRLVRPEVWGTTGAHMLITVVVLTAALAGLGVTGVGLLGELRLGPAALIAFALSFSSTVFAVKVLEESHESSALHGRLAISILVVQDVIAILFLTISLGQPPTVWALALLGLPLVRPLLFWLMTKSGHGELLVLLGILLVVGTTRLFSFLQLKPDLGALIIGALVAAHPKADELSTTLMGFKDLFLVGFFLSIGLKGAPGLESILIALALTIIVPLKSALFFLLMTRFRVRARTSLLTAMSLSNYSEFGLIVGVVGAKAGWISDDWLIVLALALAFSFAAAAPLSVRAGRVYSKVSDRLRGFESAQRLPDDKVIDPGPAQIAVFGMSRIGAGTYDQLHERYGDIVVGIERSSEIVARERAAGKRVVLGDATDSDFYAKAADTMMRMRIIMLTMRGQAEIIEATRLLRGLGFKGTIAAAAQYTDQIEKLEAAGVDAAYDLFDNAGAGFADHVCAEIGLDPVSS